MLDPDLMAHDPNTKALVIGRPVLPAFLRTRLRRLGFPTPYDYLAHLIFARKTGQDLASFYDTWDNETDHAIIQDPVRYNDMIQARDELLFIFNNFLNCCPMTMYLVHTDIYCIEETENGLIVYYTIDKDQIDSTTVYGNRPYGYIPGSLAGF